MKDSMHFLQHAHGFREIMKAVGTDDDIEGMVWKGKVSGFGLHPRHSLVLVLAHRLLQHSLANIRTDDLEIGPSSEQPTFQLPGAAGHVEDSLVALDAEAFNNGLKRRINVCSPSTVIGGCQPIIFLANGFSFGLHIL